MFQPYRRPTVAVVGAGVSGATAAAECAFSGFDTTLFDKNGSIGGRFSTQNPPEASRRARYRTPYLNTTRTNGSPQSLVRHVEAAVNAGGAKFRRLTEVTGASYNEGEGQWELTVNNGSEPELFDVLIRATGEPSPWIEVPGRKNIDVDDLYLHLGVEVVGLPNCLFVDGEYPSDAKPLGKSFAVAEARGDYARRYVRQLEIRGPGAMTVKRDRWLVQPGTLRGTKSALVDFVPDTHSFTRASNYEVTDRRSATRAS